MLFAASASETELILEKLIEALAEVGLVLNPDKTVVLTNEAQPSQQLILPTGPSFQIIQPEEGHKWLGCMLTARGSAGQDVDMECHLQQATKVFWANRLGDRLKYFDACVSSVACFASRHRTIHKKQLQTLDALFGKTLPKHGVTTFGYGLVTGVARGSSRLEREGAYVHRTVTNPNLGRPVVQPILGPCTAYLPRVSKPLGPTNFGLEPGLAT